MFGETLTKTLLDDIQKHATKIGRSAQKVEWQMAVLREKNTQLAKQNYERKKANRFKTAGFIDRCEHMHDL